MNRWHGNLIFENELFEGEIEFAQTINHIRTLGPARAHLPIMIPGFIDLHVHGGGGVDLMEAGDSIRTIAKTHAQFGTTSFLATTMTAPYEELEKAFRAMSDEYRQRSPKCARLLGVHLEGPFISKERLGAQPNYVRAATLTEIDKLNQFVPIKIVTLAPEVFNHLELIRDLAARGIIVQIGHTNGSYEEGCKALEMGARSFTHLFNAMSPLHHRNPGIVGAALAHAQHAELIPDLKHVHPGAIHAAKRAIPHLYFVTDATAATGMPDGAYKLGTQTVQKCLGGVQLPDGTLAGSALTMDQALRNLVSIGFTVEDASKRLSGIQAQLLGLPERGSLRENNSADLVILNPDLTVEQVFIEGELV